MRVAIGLLLAFLIVPPLVLGLPWGKRPEAAPVVKEKGKDKAADAPLKLPSEETLKPWTPDDRTRFAARLEKLGRSLGLTFRAGKNESALVEAVASLDRQLDQKRDRTRPARDAGKLAELGSAQSQLRAVLWKNGVKEYDVIALNPVELLERLEEQLVRDGIIKEDKHE